MKKLINQLKELVDETYVDNLKPLRRLPFWLAIIWILLLGCFTAIVYMIMFVFVTMFTSIYSIYVSFDIIINSIYNRIKFRK